nr:50S ribosome-binding GTPase [Gemmatimonadales bacterium]
VLAGRPNTGKSSLFNALLGTARALVSEIAGTTRDSIEAHTDFLGWPVLLADTAGLWEAPGTLDRMGVEVSRRYLDAADLVLLCAEAGRALEADETELASRATVTMVRTKADLAEDDGAGGIRVSIVTGEGLDAVRRAVAERVFGDRLSPADLEPGLTRARHREALVQAREALLGALPHLSDGGDAVLAAIQVRDAATALDGMLGAVDVEEVLDRIFASFCVGK